MPKTAEIYAELIGLVERVVQHDRRPIAIYLRSEVDEFGPIFVAEGVRYSRLGTGSTKAEAVARAIDQIGLHFQVCDEAGLPVGDWAEPAGPEVEERVRRLRDLCDSSDAARRIVMPTQEVPAHLNHLFEVIDCEPHVELRPVDMMESVGVDDTRRVMECARSTTSSAPEPRCCA